MQTSSVTRLLLFLVAFTRATLVVLCRGENSKPFCQAELWTCKNTFLGGSKILDLNVLVPFYNLKSNFLEVLLNLCSLFWFINISPFLLSTCYFRRNFVLVPHMSLKVHFCCMEGQTFLLVNLWQLMTASNVGACAQAWKAKWAVFKIPGFACKHFLLSFPTPSHSFTHVIFNKVLGGVYMTKLAPARVSYQDDFLISCCIYMISGSLYNMLFKGTLHVDKIHVWFKIANVMHALPIPVYRQTNFTPKREVHSRSHNTIARFRTRVKFLPRYNNQSEFTPAWLMPARHFVVVSHKQI